MLKLQAKNYVEVYKHKRLWNKTWKISLYSYCPYFNHENFQTGDRKEKSDLLKSSNYINNNVNILFRVQKKSIEGKNSRVAKTSNKNECF